MNRILGIAGFLIIISLTSVARKSRAILMKAHLQPAELHLCLTRIQLRELFLMILYHTKANGCLPKLKMA